MARYTKEQAEDTLRRYPNIDGLGRERIVAVIEGKLPQYYLSRFCFLRDNYSDELPQKDITGKTEIYNDHRKHIYKCQRNYLISLAQMLDGAVYNEVITDEKLMGDITTFRASNLNFQRGDPKNAERIADINGILNEVIGYLAPIGTPEQRTQAASFFFT